MRAILPTPAGRILPRHAPQSVRNLQRRRIVAPDGRRRGCAR